ncbi:MAG: C2H2-type zinc finger protein, partial [Thermoplasmata archaeon]|nr:C2H2-type zinc finger protein [Thermoplasmata archaeon]
EVQAVCSDCGRIFPSDDALAAHRDEAHAGLAEAAPATGAKRIECSVCHERFRSTSALLTHSRKAHTS